MTEVQPFPNTGEQEVIQVDENVSLRKIKPEDSETMFALIDKNREHLSQFGDETARKYPTVESVKERNATQSDNEKRFGIWDKSEFVGFVKVTKREEGKWEIGYWMGSEYAGRGYISKAVSALTKYTIKTLGASLVFAKVHIDNKPSIKVLEKNEYLDKGLNPSDPTEKIFELNPVRAYASRA